MNNFDGFNKLKRTSCVVQLCPLMRENTVNGAQLIRRSLSHDISYRTRLQELIFDLYRDEKTNKIFIPRFFKEWIDAGIRKDDPRLQEVINKVSKRLKRASSISFYLNTMIAIIILYVKDTMCVLLSRCVGNSIGVIGKALKKQLVIPDWPSFTKVMGELYEECRRNDRGQLARADPNSFAISVCTVDGQRMSWGDALKPFCLQSVSKPFTYALVHDELGPDELHSHVGQEPSGRLFNDICLDHNKKPHNPLINAGAIVVASLMKRHASLSDRFDFAIHQMRRFSGAGYVGFNNAVFLSERETADRNYALSYYMREHKVFPPDTSIQDTLDLYFQLCAIETNCDTLAVMAATLANGGVNPMNSERVINNRACRDTLSLMYSCGMYDWSGQFAFRIGLPAKSGVSGDMIMVIPNVMAIAIYSPRLDMLGNTYRGVRFAEAFINKFNFHNYDSLVYSDCQKMDPRKVVPETEHDNTSRFMFATKHGDISTIKRYLLLGIDIHDRDYDDRTVLHVAASEGDSTCLHYLLTKWKESPEPRDRFGRTPLDDANYFGHKECVTVLQEFIDRWTEQ
ncbi:unnamed protein product [Angiostrongylus costaricensis]|uniref:glutaminase n=1 Tax=Angiostrongylus costaricensis TaxID=334426 RepID=A0A158PIP4_ANGCS|nr:unnamed protein product [Angiostrongylus costaricensis]